MASAMASEGRESSCISLRVASALRARATRTGIPCLTTAARTVIVILQSSRPSRAREQYRGRPGAKSTGDGRACGATLAESLAQQEAGREQERDHAPHDRVAEGVGDIPEDHGAQRLADEHDAAEDAHGPAATSLGRDVHEQR